MRSVQRILAIARIYRMVAAVTILAEVPPLELLAKQYAEIYRRVQELKKRGIATAHTKNLIKCQA